MVSLLKSRCNPRSGWGLCSLAVVAGLFAVVGCSDGKPDVPFGAVTGRVTWKGEPLVDALVTFEPAKGRPSYGRTDASGVYRLEYRGKPWGAVVGEHVVRITTSQLLNPEEEQQGADPEVSSEILPRQFNRATTLNATVTEGANTINFDLTAS